MLGRSGRFLRNVVRPSGVVKGRDVQASQGSMAESSGSSGLAGLSKDEFVRGRGQAHVGDFALTKELDRTTPDLIQDTCEGQDMGDAHLDFMSPTSESEGSTGIGYDRVRLENETVEGFDVSSGAGDRSDEEVDSDPGHSSERGATKRVSGQGVQPVGDPDDE